MIESQLTRSVFGIDDDELLRAIAEIIAIPKTCILLKPMRCDLGLIHSSFGSTEAASASAIHPVCRRIVFVSRGPWLRHLNDKRRKHSCESRIGPPHSTTLARIRERHYFREVLGCGSPMPLFL